MKVLCGRVFLVSILTVLCFLAASTAFAQTTAADCEPVYQKFLANRKGPEIDKYKLALAVGKDYIAKCGSLEGNEAIKDYIAKQIPKIEENVRILQLVNRFNLAVPNKNWDDAVASGKELIALKHPLTLDIMLVMASIGYDNATADPPVDKYNTDAINFAKAALQKMSDGDISENWGAYQVSYKSKGCEDPKTNAIGWMNYAIGYIMSARQKQAKEALPYFYKATQVGCQTKGFAEIYRFIGAAYIDEARKFFDSRAEKLKLSNDQETDETMSILALAKGYTERALDAYARAVNAASANPSSPQAYRDSLNKRLDELFDVRFDGKREGIEKYKSEVMGRPFPDPSTAVKPVTEPIPIGVPPTTKKPGDSR